MNKAVFLDRDGIINETVFDPIRKIQRPPWSLSEFKLMPYIIENLERLRNSNFELFLVTNQPDFAKGLTSIKNLAEIKYHLINIMVLNKIFFKEHYYCFHHPSQAICECRKPSPYFLLKASEDYRIDLKASWMIGDRETDILAGINAGCRTILVNGRSKIQPNHTVRNIIEAVNIITGEKL